MEHQPQAVGPQISEDGGEPPLRGQPLTPRASEPQPHQLSPLLVWAVVFCDIGTSVYYVPGILYSQVGALTPLFIIATIIGFIPLAIKYQEICWRNPEGGGVVSVATKAFSPRWGVFGGFLILVCYFFTIAISTVSGLHYLATVLPIIDEYIILSTVAVLALLTSINIIGIRESAMISLTMAVAALVVDLVVIGVTMVSIGPPQWDQVWRHLHVGSELSSYTLLVGFSSAWLAFSGLESISQLSPAMRP